MYSKGRSRSSDPGVVRIEGFTLDETEIMIRDDAVWIDRYAPTFQRNSLLPSSGKNSGGTNNFHCGPYLFYGPLGIAPCRNCKDYRRLGGYGCPWVVL